MEARQSVAFGQVPGAESMQNPWSFRSRQPAHDRRQCR
jgi:hypothetical protein